MLCSDLVRVGASKKMIPRERSQSSFENNKHLLCRLCKVLINLCDRQLKNTMGHAPGLEIMTDMVANATKIFSLPTKNSGLVTTLASRVLYDLDLN